MRRFRVFSGEPPTGSVPPPGDAREVEPALPARLSADPSIGFPVEVGVPLEEDFDGAGSLRVHPGPDLELPVALEDDPSLEGGRGGLRSVGEEEGAEEGSGEEEDSGGFRHK